MKWSDEDIDHLFQKANENIQPVFDEAYWNEVEKSLPQENKKFRGFFYYMWTIVVVTSAFGAYLWLSPTRNTEEYLTFNKVSDLLGEVSSVPSVSNNNGILKVSSINPTINKVDQIEKNQFVQSFKMKEESTQNELSNQKTVVISNSDVGESAQELSLTKSVESIQVDERPIDQPIELITVDSAIIAIEQSMNTENGEKILNSNKLQRSSFIQWSVLAGAGISQSFINDQSQGILPTVNLGLQAKHSFVNVGLSIGLTISNTFAKNMLLSNHSRVYDFKKTEYEQRFNYRQLTFIELPILVDYHVKNHIISLGIAPTFLATSWLQFEESVDDKLLNSTSFVGQNYGLNKFGLRPMLGYEYMLPLNWSVGIQVSTQLFQQFERIKFTDVNTTKAPISTMFILRKTF